MDDLFREREDKDTLHEALGAFILLAAFEHAQRSVSEKQAEEAFLAHLELLEMVGANIRDLSFQNEEEKRQSIRNTLSEARLYQAMYAKTPSRSDLSYFDNSFFLRWARPAVEQLSEELDDALEKVISLTMQVLTWGVKREEVIAEFKKKLEKETVPAAT